MGQTTPKLMNECLRILLFSIAMLAVVRPIAAKTPNDNLTLEETLTDKQSEMLSRQRKLIKKKRKLLKHTLTKEQKQILNDKSKSEVQRIRNLSRTFSKVQREMLAENDRRLRAVREEFIQTLTEEQIALFNEGCISDKLFHKKVNGEIIYENDTVSVIMSIPKRFFPDEPNFERLQYKVKYFDSIGNKYTLRPNDAKEIRFKYRNKDVRMLSRFNIFRILRKDSTIFLKCEIDGELKLFNYYQVVSSGNTTGIIKKYALQKINGELKRMKTLSFKKDVAEYLNDCPDLSKEIETKKLRMSDLDAIVRYYNSHCK